MNEPSSYPCATYRIQFRPDFGFERLIPWLDVIHDLGVSHLYASPIMKAREGSAHGYDVVDPCCINPQLGGEEQFHRLISALCACGLKWIQDIVPNHMAYHQDNLWLMDVLQKGSGSRYYHFFDIYWNHPLESLKGRLLAPFLGTHYIHALTEKQIIPVVDERGLGVRYYDRWFPLSLSSWVTILSALEKPSVFPNDDDRKNWDLFETALNDLNREIQLGNVSSQTTAAAHQTLIRLLQQSPILNESVQRYLQSLTVPSQQALLDTILESQIYRLAYWKVASEEINYRRFFTVNDLIALRVEEEDVFETTHRFVRRAVEQGWFDGVRVDHIDGLFNPSIYLKRLRQLIGERLIWVEKILETNELWPDALMCDGTTGYDFLNHVMRLFCMDRNTAALTKIYVRFTRNTQPFESQRREAKRLIVEEHVLGDIMFVTSLIKRLAGRSARGRDITFNRLKEALVAVLLELDVYRTYLSITDQSDRDKTLLNDTFERARDLVPDLDEEILFLRDFFLKRLPFTEHLIRKEEYAYVLNKFQQLSSVVMAKGLEDTLFYRYNRCVALNEVGGNPLRFKESLSDWVYFLHQRQKRHPLSLNATATHDTKRGEDARMRLCVLSEMPQRWHRLVTRWHRINASKKQSPSGTAWPEPNMEYLLYQTFLAAFPFEDDVSKETLDRLTSYAVKAAREAKQNTSWSRPNKLYEDALIRFIELCFEDTSPTGFLSSFLPFKNEIAFYGVLNSLSQTALKITMPGVPDFYQGTELWDFSLVDPDNRRPVDWSKRRVILERMKQVADPKDFTRRCLENHTDGAIKMWVINRLLQARGKDPEFFIKADVASTHMTGPHRHNLLALLRSWQDQRLIVLAVRFASHLVRPFQMPLGPSVWKNTALVVPPDWEGDYEDIISGELVTLNRKKHIGEIVRRCPVVCLKRVKNS